jgi:hypothetical protein
MGLKISSQLERSSSQFLKTSFLAEVGEWAQVLAWKSAMPSQTSHWLEWQAQAAARDGAAREQLAD